MNLSIAERTRYEVLKQAARQGFIAFILATKEIRDSRLYREEYGTWEAFCQAEHHYTRQYVNLLIRAVELEVEFGNHGFQIDSERQARALAGLNEEEQVEAFLIAQAAAPVTVPSKKPTAALLEEAADTVREIKATGGFVTVNGEMNAAVASVIEKHAERVQSRREEVDAQRDKQNGAIVTITKRSACRIVAARDRQVVFEFDDPETARKLAKLYYKKAGHGLFMDLNKKHKSSSE